MNEKIEKTLEFDKIKYLVSEYAQSTEAKKLVLNMRPDVHSENKLSDSQKENEAVLDLIRLRGSASFLGTKDISDIIKHLEVKASLTIKELLNVSDILTLTERFIDYLKNTEVKETAIPNSEKEKANNLMLEDSVLKKYFVKLDPITNINNEIKRIIVSEEEIDDNATTTLHSLRVKRKTLENKLHQTANSLLNTYKDYLQEAVVTQKNGKYCLPIKAEYKQKVPGTLQDQSSTSFTLFIEPIQIVEMNNEITKLLLDEQIEINKILHDLSLDLSNYTESLTNDYTTLIYLDFLFAKGKFHKDYNCTLPIINDTHYINLKNARHPLIQKEKCVPLNIYIGQEFNQLIITGPNTGGKTVALKTLGLLEIMALSGLFIPCDEGSEISIFNEIFADIGDEQSIEQSLSTFSSHMVNVINILKEADKNSLCLFDELGAGTDPTEGASLAISILEELKQRNATVLATTHYPEIKMYALATEGVMNASCEFDVNSLKPTYKLLIGLPGKSNAFLISEKLGLSKNIIDKAKEKLSKDDIKFEDVVSSLNESKLIIEKERKEIEEYKKEISELKQHVKRQQKGLQNREESIIRKAKEDARNILQDAKETADKAIKNIKQLETDATSASIQRSSINKELNDLNESIYNDDKKKQKGPTLPISPKKIKIGDKVHILSLDTEASVETLPDKDFCVYVRAGFMRTKVNLRDLEFSNVYQSNQDLNKQNKKRTSSVYIPTSSKNANSEIRNSKSLTISPEINVIGLTSDEALAKVEKYIDDAYLSNIPKVRVIHGRGTGVLKNTIQKYLKKLDFVKDFHPAEVYDGGDGATIVEFN